MIRRSVQFTRAQEEQAARDMHAELQRLPHPLHSKHDKPVQGCDRCDDLMDEARELASEWHNP